MVEETQLEDATKRGRIQGTLFDTSQEELIISVAFTFALLNAPGLLTDLIATIRMHFPNMISIIYAYVALSMAIYVLLFGFALHLFMRSAWVAFHGLHSVFPEGVLWDKIKTKPHQKRVMQDQWLTLEQLIILTDKISSTVLALTMSFLVTALILLVFCSFGSLVLLVLVNLGLVDAKFADPLGFLIYLTPLLPKMIAQILMGFVSAPEAGEQPTSLYRFWERCDRIGNMFMLLNVAGTVPSIITSHFNRATMISISVIVMSFWMILLATNIIPSNQLIAFNYTYWEAENPREIRSAAYRDERSTVDWSSDHPFVDQRIQSEPYWQLHLPYFPKYEKQLHDICPEIKQSVDDLEARNDRFLKCFHTYMRVQLNDKPLQDGDWFFQQHGQRDLHTISGVFPRKLLKQGLNRLTIERGNPDSDDDPTLYYIHVWNP